MKRFLAASLLLFASVQLIDLGTLRADDTSPDKAAQKKQVSICVVSGEHLQAGDIVTYVYKEEGKPDRTVRFCCRKCLARFKADPARYLQKLDQLEAATKDEAEQ